MTTSHALEDKYNAEDDAKKISKHAQEKEASKTSLEKLPYPTGWRLLVMPFKVKEETKGGIIIAQETLDRARVATQVGYVLKMGDLCYKDEDKFPTGPWCKEKDWVIFARYAGSRMEIDGGEIRMLNDDEVLGIIGKIHAIDLMNQELSNLLEPKEPNNDDDKVTRIRK